MASRLHREILAFADHDVLLGAGNFEALAVLLGAGNFEALALP